MVEISINKIKNVSRKSNVNKYKPRRPLSFFLNSGIDDWFEVQPDNVHIEPRDQIERNLRDRLRLRRRLRNSLQTSDPPSSNLTQSQYTIYIPNAHIEQINENRISPGHFCHDLNNILKRMTQLKLGVGDLNDFTQYFHFFCL